MQTMGSKQMSKILKKDHFSFMDCLYYMKEIPSLQAYAIGLSVLPKNYKVIFLEMLEEHPLGKGMKHVIELDPTKGSTMVYPSSI